MKCTKTTPYVIFFNIFTLLEFIYKHVLIIEGDFAIIIRLPKIDLFLFFVFLLYFVLFLFFFIPSLIFTTTPQNVFLEIIFSMSIVITYENARH